MAQVAARVRSKRNETIAAIAEACGAPRYDHRLSDKILAAFNHAYASGVLDTARQLKSLLADVEHRERTANDRHGIGAVERADLWVAFVDARNRYNALSVRKGATPAQLETAIAAMMDAYRAWSDAT